MIDLYQDVLLLPRFFSGVVTISSLLTQPPRDGSVLPARETR